MTRRNRFYELLWIIYNALSIVGRTQFYRKIILIYGTIFTTPEYIPFFFPKNFTFLLTPKYPRE